jgi:carbon monoxide dehydrogenase subunit G
MIEHELEVSLSQSVDEVYAFFLDIPNEPAWNPECLSVEQTSQGPIAAGSTFTGRMRGVGRMTAEILAADRPVRIAMVERSAVATGTFEFRFEPEGQGTRLHFSARVQPRGPLRMLQPLMRRKFGKLMRELPANMRRGIDAADHAA